MLKKFVLQTWQMELVWVLNATSQSGMEVTQAWWSRVGMNPLAQVVQKYLDCPEGMVVL
jgi:hypothetical protein